MYSNVHTTHVNSIIFKNSIIAFASALPLPLHADFRLILNSCIMQLESVIVTKSLSGSDLNLNYKQKHTQTYTDLAL